MSDMSRVSDEAMHNLSSIYRPENTCLLVLNLTFAGFSTSSHNRQNQTDFIYDCGLPGKDSEVFVSYPGQRIDIQ